MANMLKSFEQNYSDGNHKYRQIMLKADDQESSFFDLSLVHSAYASLNYTEELNFKYDDELS